MPGADSQYRAASGNAEPKITERKVRTNKSDTFRGTCLMSDKVNVDTLEFPDVLKD